MLWTDLFEVGARAWARGRAGLREVMMCFAAEMPKRLRCDPAECMECLADVGDTGFGECGQAGRWNGAAQVRTLTSIESGVGADDACALDLKQAGPQASKQGSKPKPSIIKSTIDICSRHTFEAPVQCTSGFAPSICAVDGAGQFPVREHWRSALFDGACCHTVHCMARVGVPSIFELAAFCLAAGMLCTTGLASTSAP